MGLISSYHCFFLGLLIFCVTSQENRNKTEVGGRGVAKYVFRKPCPRGWLRYKRSCYGYHKSVLPWFYAETDCHNYNIYSHLVSINSRAEMRRITKWVLQRIRSPKPIWIGLYRIRSGKRQRWRWTDLAATHYTNWKEMEPGIQDIKEDCVMMEYQAGELKWNDADCYLSYNYICKISNV